LQQIPVSSSSRDQSKKTTKRMYDSKRVEVYKKKLQQAGEFILEKSTGVEDAKTDVQAQKK